MASDIEIRTRPPIEVCFKDLTLTLKGKNKHLLRCVSGKLSPGRVSAVMGPSGAGKTTFLSALTGKAAGCTVTRVILLNGKPEPVQSYKKIIGFVPQNDIVHGNLTVEQNLWFSARCRLASDLPKPEKVLVVERVIESLGLQPVRDSLVGTVEKRGISGGQRKRVNVGLEMVMEPSLLILDEPTSGWDSSSSQLLLRATRRETLEGVNVCMVVHQPSYSLFRMLDDLVLLAKGGLTVYHGPVKTVEEYFVGIGITVPDRVNPPDHFIDILEGIYKLPSTGLNYKDLPVRWMIHNGYPIPPDMLDSSGSQASSVGENSADGASPAAATSDQSGDLWSDIKSNVAQKKDRMRFNFLAWSDLSHRKTPGVLLQYKYFLVRRSRVQAVETAPCRNLRVGKQRLREARLQAVDCLILLLAGICLGTVADVSDESFGFIGYLYTVIAVPLLINIAVLRSFSLDKLHYWRESASGMSSLAYFMAKDTVDHINTIWSVLLPVVLTLIASKDKQQGDERIQDLGNQYFDELRSRSLFERVPKSSERDGGKFLMHDLVNDLAQTASSKLCVRLEDCQGSHMLEQSRHLSYSMGEGGDFKKLNRLSKSEQLRTLLPIQIELLFWPTLSKRVLHNILPRLTSLRALSLSRYEIVELPDALFIKLKFLRFLDLSRTEIKKLPDSICALYNLETLILSSCTNLEERLSKMEDLGEASYLYGSLSVLELENVVDGREAQKAKMRDEKKNHVEKLSLEWSGSDADNSQTERDILADHSFLKLLV
ncbi:hypothetical protein P3S67_013842 [Capsicum chacoense]